MPAPVLPVGVTVAASGYVSDALLESVRRRTRMPVSQATFDAWDILRIADEQVSGYVAPLMIEVAEDYLTAVHDVPILAASYRPHPRAMKLREIQFLDSSGDEVDVPRIAEEDLPYKRFGFHFRGDEVRILKPQEFAGYTLRRTYYRRPSRLVLAADCGVCSSVNRGTGVVTLHAAAPFASQTVDLVSGVAPFTVLAADVAATVAGASVTLAAADIPAEWGASGDFVCIAGQSPGPQVHPDLFALLAQAVAVELLDGAGDTEAFQRAAEVLKGLDSKARVILTQRVEGEPLAFASRNPLWDTRWNRR
jgi:hypothetical protein